MPLQIHLEQINILHLKKKPLLKQAIKGCKNFAGRNRSGKITIWHKGKGHKRNYRKINFNSFKIAMGISCSIEYDPNRNAHIIAIYDIIKNIFCYIIGPKGAKVGDSVKCCI